MSSSSQQPDSMADEAVVLSVEGLGKSFYLHERELEVPSAHGVSLDVRAGEMTALTGPSGSGKSSLLKCIYRTYLTGDGVIWYRRGDGEIIDLASSDERTILELRQAEIRFVTQFLHCLPRRSTLQVVAKPAMDAGIDQSDAMDRAANLLRAVNLPEHLWNVPPTTFSGGEKQRVNVARGLITEPRLLLLDEPTASLDSYSAGLVVEMIQHQKSRGCAILSVLHDQQLVMSLAEEEVKLAACDRPTQTTTIGG